MNQLEILAKQYEADQRELKASYAKKVQAIFADGEFSKILSTIEEDTKRIEKYRPIYTAYLATTDETVKQVLLEKLQEIYKEVCEIQIKIAKAMHYTDPDIISVDTISKDVKSLENTNWLKTGWLFGTYEYPFSQYLNVIKEIHAMNETFIDAPSSETYNDVFIKMSEEEIINHNKGIKEKAETMMHDYNRQIAEMKNIVPNKQMRKDPSLL